MSGDSGGDTGTSCLEHNFFSGFEACPRCMVDVANMRIKWPEEELDLLKIGLCLPEVDLSQVPLELKAWISSDLLSVQLRRFFELG